MPFVVIAQLCLIAYHQTTTWFDFFPFNGVRFTKAHERRAEAVVNFTLMGIAPFGYALKYEPLMRFGVIYYFVLFAIECATWWAPYFWGASPRWQEIFDRVHARTIILVPRRGENPVPNLEHLILMVMTLAVAFITLHEYQVSLHGSLYSLWIGWTIGGLATIFTLVQMVRREPMSK